MAQTTRGTRTTARTRAGTKPRGAALTPAHQARTLPTGTANRQDAQTIRKAAAQAMRELGMSQAQIAERLGYSLNTIRNDLRG